jgi:ribosomal protein L7/L12
MLVESRYIKSSTKETDMKFQSIRAANNGFVLESTYGDTYIAKTLIEVAQLAGEIPPTDSTAVYAPNMGANQLTEAKSLAQQGYKIDAIKKLRDCFVPRLGLREAKDLIERLCA